MKDGRSVNLATCSGPFRPEKRRQVVSRRSLPAHPATIDDSMLPVSHRFRIPERVGGLAYGPHLPALTLQPFPNSLLSALASASYDPDQPPALSATSSSQTLPTELILISQAFGIVGTAAAWKVETMSKQGSAYTSYLLRLWRVASEEGATWRASLESPHSGERWGFASVDEMCEFLRRHLQIAFDTDEGMGTDRSA